MTGFGLHEIGHRLFPNKYQEKEKQMPNIYEIALFTRCFNNRFIMQMFAVPTFNNLHY